MAYIKRGGIVEADGVGQDGKPKFKILKEGAKDNFEVEIIKCAKCQKDITEADLVESGKCKKCGRMVNPTDLNDAGVCPVCAMLETNPEINDMSVDDLKFMVAKMMMQNSSVKKDISSKEDKADKVEAKAAGKTKEETPVVEEPAQEKTGDDILNDVLGGSTAPTKEEPPKKPRRKMKKATAKAEDTPDGTAESTQEDAAEEIAESQDAPFPDIDGAMNQPEEAPGQEQGEQPIGAGNDPFKMFDDNEEDQPF